MAFERVPGTTNVYRFPVEDRARPTLDLLRQLQPDLRELAPLAETLGLEPPGAFLREAADAEARSVVEAGVGTLGDLVAERIAVAVESCRQARRATALARIAEQRWAEAVAAGGHYLPPLRERAIEGARMATALALVAHHRAEAAEALVRAQRQVSAGRPLLPVDRRAEAEALFFGGGCG